jgi:hypothetical protein
LILERPVSGVGARFRTEASTGEVDWRLVVETAERLGVMALVLRRLGRLGLVPPQDLAKAGETYLARQAERNSLLIRTLKEVLRALDAAGIEAIPFKGPAVAQLAYGDLALRRYRDLDILVRDKDAEAACTVLAGLGFRNADVFTPAQQAAFRRYSGQDIVFRDGIAIEPHWALAPRTLALDVDYGGLFRRARDIVLDGDTVRCFGAEDLVTVLCLHGSKEEWGRLLWISDLAHVIAATPRLDWHALLGRARERGVLRMVVVGLALASALLDSVAAPVQEAIARDGRARALAEQAAARLFDADVKEVSIYRFSPFRWHMRERPADRLRYLIRTATTPRDVHFSLLQLPDALFFLYTPLKLLHDYGLVPVWSLGKRLGAFRGG